MKRWLAIIGVVVWAVWLAGCGGDDGDQDADQSGPPDQSDGLAVPASPTSPAPRWLPMPSGDPAAFQPPESLGEFRRDSMRDRATATQIGGLKATYQGWGEVLTLNVYYFGTPAQAQDTVRFMLEQRSIVQLVEPLYTDAEVAYGIGQGRQGGYLAAWSHDRWMFAVQTGGELEALYAFLEVFPY
jgi:hypothetical protein